MEKCSHNLQTAIENLKIRSQKPLCLFNLNEHLGQYYKKEVFGYECRRKMNGHDGVEMRSNGEFPCFCQINFTHFILLLPDCYTLPQLPVLHYFYLFMWQLYKTTFSRRFFLIQFSCAQKGPDYKNFQSPLGAKVNSSSESHE